MVAALRNGLLARRAPGVPPRAGEAGQRAADNLVAELVVDAQARALEAGVVYTEFGPGLIGFFITEGKLPRADSVVASRPPATF